MSQLILVIFNLTLPILSMLMAPPQAVAAESLSADDIPIFIKALGLVFDHRPYASATPLGTIPGISFGLELSLVKPPEEFVTVASSSGGLLPIPATLPVLPSPRLHIQKGLGPNFNLGASFIGYSGAVLLMGAHGQYAFLNPEEGPTVAARLSYNWLKLQAFKTQTWTAQVLVSKKMDFADPYIGVGYQYVTGSVGVELSFAGITQSIEFTGRGQSAMAMMGVQFRIPNLGAELTLEGSYSQFGAHTLGTKIGLAY